MPEPCRATAALSTLQHNGTCPSSLYTHTDAGNPVQALSLLAGYRAVVQRVFHAHASFFVAERLRNSDEVRFSGLDTKVKVRRPHRTEFSSPRTPGEIVRSGCESLEREIEARASGNCPVVFLTELLFLEPQQAVLKLPAKSPILPRRGERRSRN